jgi:hypothetical protein
MATRKKPAARKRPAKRPATPPVSPEILDQTIALLLTLESTHQVQAALTSDKLALTGDQAAAAIDAAREAFARLAGFDRTREMGKAIGRLNNLYRRSVQVQDCKTALAAQRELHKLLALGSTPLAAAKKPDTAANEPDLAREHLARALPNHAGLPLDELARLAAAAIIDARHA